MGVAALLTFVVVSFIVTGGYVTPTHVVVLVFFISLLFFSVVLNLVMSKPTQLSRAFGPDDAGYWDDGEDFEPTGMEIVELPRRGTIKEWNWGTLRLQWDDPIIHLRCNGRLLVSFDTYNERTL